MPKKNIDWKAEREKSVVQKIVKTNIIRPKTYNQKRFWEGIENNTLTVCNGPAGTGKTLIPCAIAANMLTKGQIEKIIISRPLVTCGSEEVGILPGSLEEKTGPYIMHIKEMFKDLLPEKEIISMATSGLIEFFPLAFMRGFTIRDAFVLLDEAENATQVQLTMFTTRFGENCKAVVSGDLEQTDIPGREGFSHLISIMEQEPPIEGGCMITMDDDDILRSGITKEMQKRWRILKKSQNRRKKS